MRPAEPDLFWSASRSKPSAGSAHRARSPDGPASRVDDHDRRPGRDSDPAGPVPVLHAGTSLWGFRATFSGFRYLLAITGLTCIGYAWAFGVPAACAEPDPETPIDVYATTHARMICSALDSNPTLTGIAGVVIAVAQGSNFTDTQTAQAIALALAADCPNHLALFDLAIADYEKQQSRLT